MSKYTTEVRFICESEAGYDESQGYLKIDDIVEQAAPHIFDFDFPIFDENYRLPLEKRILKHFYTREICEETVGLWKLRLEDRLNLIMPYYNKLYESELLEFNPLYDTDYTKTGQNELTGESADRLVANEVHDNTNVRTLNTRSVEDTDTTDSNTRTLNTTKTEDTETTDNNTRTLNTTHSEDTQVDDDNTRTLNTTKTEDTDTTDNNTRTLNTTDSENSADVKKNLHWDLFSDTPQGGINGITADNDSVANNTYLTNARKITDDGTGSSLTKTVNNTGTIGDAGTGSKDSSIRDTGTIVDDRTIDTDSTVRETGTIADVGTGSKDSSVRETGTIGDAGTGTKDTTVAETGTISDDEDKQRDLTENRTGTVSNLNEYSERVIGKMSSVSYSKYLKEFRETFLRIDELVMKELEPLFFGLWL